MLASPSHAVIGASSLDASADYLARFGFERAGQAELPATAAQALYGLDGAGEEMLLRVPGADAGWLRLVATPHGVRPTQPLDRRPFAIDLYSTDIEKSAAVGAEAGAHVGQTVTHQFGPMTIKELEIKGPDDLIVTLLELDARRPSILDEQPERLHSELHALVWSVAEMDRLLPFWLEQAGLQIISDATFESAELAGLLGLPERTIEARLIVMGDAEAMPSRLEMIEFLGEKGQEIATFPLSAGLHAPAFHVADLDQAIGSLGDAELGKVVELDTPIHGRARAVSALAPGGLRFELWQEQ